MTHKISALGPASDDHRLPPSYQPLLLPLTMPWLRIASEPSEVFSNQIRQASLSDGAWYHLLETHLINTNGVSVEIPLPGLGRLELSLTHHGQFLGIDVTGGSSPAQNWVRQHRATIERRLQAKTGRMVSLARGQKDNV